jgi:hypothetical protein
MKRWFILCVFLLTLSGSTFAPPARVDPRVLEDTAEGATARFIVVLKAQPNTRALVAAEANRAARGRIVFDALRRAAQATQPALRAQLDALGARYRAFTVVNAFVVEGNRAVVDALAARADVLAIEADRAFRVNLPRAENAPAAPNGIEWNVSQINAPAVWGARLHRSKHRVRERGYRRAMDASCAATTLSRLEWRGRPTTTTGGTRFIPI